MRSPEHCPVRSATHRSGRQPSPGAGWGHCPCSCRGGLGNSVHRYRTLQRQDDLALGDHLVQVQSLRQSHRSLHSNFTERVRFVYQVQLVVIDSNVVEIICDNVNGDCVVDDSIDAKAVVSYILPLTGSNITVRKIGVDLLVVVQCCSMLFNTVQLNIPRSFSSSDFDPFFL